MVQLSEDVPLVLDVLHLVEPDHLPQRENLHGVVGLAGFVEREADTPECS